MTNGEKLCIDFPNMHYTLSEKQPRRVVTTIGVCASFDLEWWNAEYEEPKCQWIKYDYRTICPKEHVIIGSSPYWRIPDNMNALKYCPYCGSDNREVKE